MKQPASGRREREDWLRRAGLPLVLSPSARLRGLLLRAAPATWALAFIVASWSIATRSEHELDGVDLDSLAPTDPRILRGLAALALIPGALLAMWLAHRIMRRAPIGLRVSVAVFGIGVALTAPQLVGHGEWPPGVGTRLLLLGALWVASYAGLGDIIGWIARRGVKALEGIGPMLTRVLPILVVATMFFFFNAEMWQVAANLSAGRAVVVGVVLVLIGAVVIAVGTRDELNRLRTGTDDRHELENPARLLRDTPFVAVSRAAAPPLRGVERINLLLVPVLAQILQVVVVAVLVTIFFVAFGALAVPQQTASSWIGHAPEPYPGLLAGLAGSWTLLKVAGLLGAFSGLSVAASSSNDPTYQHAFVGPIIDEMQVGVAARDSYVVTADQRSARSGDDPGSDRDVIL